MFTHNRVAPALTMLLGLLAVQLLAQNSSVRGELSGGGLNDFSVELSDNQRNSVRHATVGLDDKFELQQVPPGLYTLKVVRPDSQIVVEEMVNVPDSGALRISVPEAPAERGPAGLVSAERLRHPISKKGALILERAQNASHAGRHEQAIAEARKAMADPTAAPYAHGLVGQEYMKLGQMETALPELEQAVATLPRDPVNHSNFGYALCLTRQCEREIRKSLELEPNSPAAHFLLGSILVNRGRDAEALTHLKFAAERNMRSAHAVLAVYYERRGEKDSAQQELRAYLGEDHALELPTAQGWLTQMASGLVAPPAK